MLGLLHPMQWPFLFDFFKINRYSPKEDDQHVVDQSVPLRKGVPNAFVNPENRGRYRHR